MNSTPSLSRLLPGFCLAAAFALATPLSGSIVLFDTTPYGSWDLEPPASLPPSQVPAGIQVSGAPEME